MSAAMSPKEKQKTLGVRLKLKRAKEHITEFEQAVGAFKKDKVCVLGTKRYPGQPNFRAVYIKSIKKIPDRLAIIAGDALFNLRSALDHLAMAFWLNAGNHGNCRHVSFPIASSASRYRAESDRRMKDFDFNAKKAIDVIQPYQGGNGHSLWVLNELNNIDKHRLLLTVAMSMQPFNHGEAANRHLKRLGHPEANFRDLYIVQKKDGDLMDCISYKQPNVLYAIKSGDVITGFPKDSDYYKDVKPIFEVAFDESQVGDGDTGVKTLNDLLEFVTKVINQLSGLL